MLLQSHYLGQKQEESSLYSVQLNLFKSFCVPVIMYALEAVSPNKSSVYMLDNLVNRAVFRIFRCSSMSDILFIRNMFGLATIGEMLEHRKNSFICQYRCSVPFADAVLRCI